jgi:hypothetical protein
MPTRPPRHFAEETARRGDAIYERKIRSHVEKTHRGKVVAIEVESGAYRVADKALARLTTPLRIVSCSSRRADSARGAAHLAPREDFEIKAVQ